MQTEGYISDQPQTLPGQRRIWQRPGFWLIAAAAPAVAGNVSWFLAGNEVWRWGTLGGACLLFFIGAGALRAPEMRGRDWAAVGYVLGYLALVWGVWTGIGYFFPLTNMTIEASKGEPDGATRVTYSGDRLGELDASNKCTFSIRGRFYPSLLKVETFGPKGWVERSFRNYGEHVSLEDVPKTTLYIDNRNHARIRLECGELQFEIAAEKTEQHVMLAPSLVNAIPLRIDDKEAGFLEQGFYLIDVTGTRAYRFQALVYGGTLVHIFDPNQHLKEPPAQSYRSRHLHRLPRQVDYFLEKAPDKITVTTLQGLGAMMTEDRWQLVEEN